MPPKPVIQRDPTGCGIASVAALARVSYARAKSAARVLGIDIGDPRLWSETRHVRALLRRFGIRAAAGETPFRSWKTLPDLALLAIKWHQEKGQPCWHWVVFVRDGQRACVLDPKQSLRTHVRTDFGRIRPKWFIGIL